MLNKDPDEKEERAKDDDIRMHMENFHFEAYLKEKGHTLESIKKLTEEEARKIRKEASIYASGKLAEIEIRARFVHDLQDASRQLE